MKNMALIIVSVRIVGATSVAPIRGCNNEQFSFWNNEPVGERFPVAKSRGETPLTQLPR